MNARPYDPLVSVIIPAYRAARELPEALASVFAQTFTNYEVVVVNDGSPDTPDLEAAIAPIQSRIRYIVQRNQGAAAARNTGLRAARGRCVAFLDADDVWTPDCLETQMAFLWAAPEHTMVYADAVITGESALAGRTFMETTPSAGTVDLLSLIEQHCNVLMSTVVCDREAILEVGLFDEELRRGQDYDLWLRLAARGHRIGYQRRLLGERRVHADGLSGNQVRELERAIHVLDRFGRRHELPAAERTALRIRLMQLSSQLELEHGKRRLVEGDFAAARRHIGSAKPKTLRVHAALLALRLTPRLLRRSYLALRVPAHERPATS